MADEIVYKRVPVNGTRSFWDKVQVWRSCFFAWDSVMLELTGYRTDVDGCKGLHGVWCVCNVVYDIYPLMFIRQFLVWRLIHASYTEGISVEMLLCDYSLWSYSE